MDDNSDWDAIMERVPGVITEHFESGEPAVKTETPSAGAKRHKFGFKQVETRSREEQMEIVKTLLDQEINPAVAAHGGFFTLLDVKDNNVYVQLGGGCQGCGMADVTLKQGVEQRMREVLPEMASLIDTTDHAAGSNPYYSPGK
ncbi:MAG: NifU family protein [SAR324 cluster bacterium]|nr:NifU family protein [SAR324 cluster bacterium]